MIQAIQSIFRMPDLLKKVRPIQSHRCVIDGIPIEFGGNDEDPIIEIAFYGAPSNPSLPPRLLGTYMNISFHNGYVIPNLTRDTMLHFIRERLFILPATWKVKVHFWPAPKNPKKYA